MTVGVCVCVCVLRLAVGGERVPMVSWPCVKTIVACTCDWGTVNTMYTFVLLLRSWIFLLEVLVMMTVSGV